MEFSSRFECVKTRGSRIGGLKDRMLHGTRGDGGVHIPTHGVVSSPVHAVISSTAMSGCFLTAHMRADPPCRKSINWAQQPGFRGSDGDGGQPAKSSVSQEEAKMPGWRDLCRLRMMMQNVDKNS